MNKTSVHFPLFHAIFSLGTVVASFLLFLLAFFGTPRTVRAQTPEPVVTEKQPPATQSTVTEDDQKSTGTLAHEYATVNGVKLHYVTQGTGPVLLLLHGFPEFWYMWRNQIAEFAKTHRVIAPDMRGYNLSDKPKKVSDYAMPVLVADIKAFIGAVAPDSKVTLVGHDWGGAVVWAYAAYYPETLDKVVIISAPHPTLFLRELRANPFQLQASSMMFMVQDSRAETMLRKNDYALLSKYFFESCSKPATYTSDDHKAYRDAWEQPGALTGALNYFRAAEINAPAPPKAQIVRPVVNLPMVTVPTLILWGDRDPGLMIGNLTGLEKLVTKLTIRRFPSGGHWLVHDEPEAVNRAIRDFITPAP
ncbi:MAG: alpha/beta hydrolase [Akkermansiaceae bacterium]|nr:alpha/beta hydrolase [Armatimonadota bacterium]